jgi:hypothetical protein
MVLSEDTLTSSEHVLVDVTGFLVLTERSQDDA